MKKVSLIIALLLVTLSLIGCAKKIEDYDVMPFMSPEEYSNNFVNKQNVKLNNKKFEQPEKIEIIDCDPYADEILRNQTIALLKDINSIYGYSVPEKVHDNYKLALDNLISQGDIQLKLSKYNGFYYADVSSKFIKNTDLYELKKVASYIGIKGAIGLDLSGEEAVDKVYLKWLIDKVNNARALNGKDPVDTEIEDIDYLSEFNADEIITDESLLSRLKDEAKEEVKEDLSEEYEISKTEKNIFEDIENQEAKSTVRRLMYNAQEFNEVAGITPEKEQIIPNILSLFKCKKYDNLSGYSLYDYGRTTPELEGNEKEAHLVFVYKYNIEEDQFDLVTFYIGSIKSSKTISNKTHETFIDEFTKRQLEIAIEDLHCAMKDKDLARLTSGELVYPQDLGISLLKYRDTINILGSTMKLDEVLSSEGNSYLVKVFQQDTEAIEGTTTSGTKYYKEWIMRFEIKKAKVTLVDMYLLNQNCLRIPSKPDDKGSILKLYSSQNVVNGASDELMVEVKEELRKLCSAMTYGIPNDLLREDNTIKVAGNGVEGWGYISRFNPDNTVLPQLTRDSYIQKIQAFMTRFGTKELPQVASNTQVWYWSSNENQVAVKVCLYGFWGTRFMQANTYNMVFSKLKGKWVIDEMTLIEKEEITKADMIKGYRKQILGEEK